MCVRRINLLVCSVSFRLHRHSYIGFHSLRFICSQVTWKVTHDVTSITSFLKSCLKVTRIYPTTSYRKRLIKDSDTPRLMFYVYGFDVSDRICLVSIVMTLVVDCLLGCVYPTILTGPPYIPFCLYHLPKRHMMYAHF